MIKYLQMNYIFALNNQCGVDLSLNKSTKQTHLESQTSGFVPQLTLVNIYVWRSDELHKNDSNLRDTFVFKSVFGNQF